MALNILNEATKAAKSSAKPAWFDLVQLEGDTIDIGARPSDKESPASVPVRWLQNGTKASVDFSKLLSIRPFDIPAGTYAIIPISMETVVDVGETLIIHLSQAQFKPVVEGKRKKAKKAKPATQPAQAAAPETPTAPAENAAAASDPVKE